MVVIGLSVAGMAVAIELVRRAPSDTSLAGVGPVGYLPKPEPGILRPAPRPEPAYPEAEQELGFSRLMDILGAEAAKPEIAPAAEVFKKAFNAQPTLRKTFREFKAKADRGEKPSAKAFFAALRANPAFGRLVSEFGRGSGSGAMMALARQPDLKRFLNQQDRELAAAGKGAGPAGRSARTAYGRGGSGTAGLEGARQSSLVNAFGALASRAPATAEGNATTFGGTRPQEPARTSTDGAGAVAGPGPGAGNPATGAGGSNPRGNLPGGTDPGVDPNLDDEWKDKPIGSEGMAKEIRDWLNRNGLDADAYMNNRDSGFWDLCFQRGELKKCHDACASNPPRAISGKSMCSPPGDPTYWGTCMIVHGDEGACLKACKEQAPCKVNDAAVERLCRKPKREGRAPHANCRYVPGFTSTPDDPVERALLFETSGCATQACADAYLASFSDPNSPNYQRNYNIGPDGNPIYENAMDWFRRTAAENPERAKELVDKYPAILRRYPGLKDEFPHLKD